MSYQATEFLLKHAKCFELTRTEMLVAHAFAYHAHEPGRVSRPGMQTVANEALLKHRQTAQANTRKLEEKGFLISPDKKKGGRTPTSYVIASTCGRCNPTVAPPLQIAQSPELHQMQSSSVASDAIQLSCTNSKNSKEAGNGNCSPLPDSKMEVKVPKGFSVHVCKIWDRYEECIDTRRIYQPTAEIGEAIVSRLRAFVSGGRTLEEAAEFIDEVLWHYQYNDFYMGRKKNPKTKANYPPILDLKVILGERFEQICAEVLPTDES